MVPAPERCTSWQTFLRAIEARSRAQISSPLKSGHGRGLVTCYTVYVIDVASRRVHILGSTPFPNDLFMRQVTRTLTAADHAWFVGHRVLICDRDAKWSALVRERLGEAAIRVVQTPFLAPNANAYAERFVRSIKHECLNRVMPFGDRHLRRTIAEYVEHYHRDAGTMRHAGCR
jgi:putative transposase